MADRTDWEKLFRKVDGNGNGYVTAGELAKEMKRIGYPGTEDKIKVFLCAADTSGDRKLSLTEFMEALDRAPAEFHVAALLHTVFSLIDKTGDGEITRDELAIALGRMGKRPADWELDSMIQSMDSNGSGTINIREFLNGVSKRLL